MYSRFRFALTSLAILAVLLATFSLSVSAQVAALGSDFAVNSYTPGDQYRPSVSSNTEGETVAAWTGRRPFPFTVNERDGIFAQRFGRNGQPVGPEFAAVWLDGLLEAGPEVAMAADGSFVVAWVERRPLTTESRLLVSRFGPGGNVLFSRVAIDVSFGGLRAPTVAMAPAGSVVVAWVREEGPPRVYARGFKLDGEPWGPAERISRDFGLQYAPSITALLDNRYVVAWTSEELNGFGDGVVGRILGFDGVALSAELPIDGSQVGRQSSPAVTAVGSASFAVVWEDSPDAVSGVQIYGRIFDGRGLPRGAPFLVSRHEDDIEHRFPSVAGGSGRLLVAWERQSVSHIPASRQPVLRAFSLAGEPLSPQVAANSFDSASHTAPRVAALGPDRYLGVWESSPIPPVVPVSAAGSDSIDGDGSAIAGRLFELSSDQLYLNRDRFRLEVDWRDPRGDSGRGRAIALSRDTGYFWFFNRDNVELTIKVLDGRAVNGAYWVFYGSLTNVEFTLTVTDTVTGVEKSFHNPQGRLRSIADTNAFPVTTLPTSSVATGGLGASLPLNGLVSLPAGKTSGGCATGGESLCLNGSRFRLEIDWRDPRSGKTGRGQAFGLTDDTGYFWFFNRDNVELVVKVLDGRPVNGNFWVLFGALSDLEYTLTVTDTETGAERTYFNPPFTLTSFADTAAF